MTSPFFCQNDSLIGDHIGKRTAWSLIYFFIYAYLNILAQSQILVISLYKLTLNFVIYFTENLKSQPAKIKVASQIVMKSALMRNYSITQFTRYREYRVYKYLILMFLSLLLYHQLPTTHLNYHEVVVQQRKDQLLKIRFM